MAWGRVSDVVRPLTHEDFDVAALPGWGGDRVVLAGEHKQAAGSFRVRGAVSWLRAVRSEGAVPAAGIAVTAVTEASAAAWVWAASVEEVPATVFVPPPLAAAARRLTCGAVSVEVGDGDPGARRDAHAVATGALQAYRHDRLLAAGAGTWVLDLHACMWDVATVLIPVRPVDDDGLLAGTVSAAHRYGIKVVLVALPGTPIPGPARETLAGARFPGTPAAGRGVRLELVRVSAADVEAAAAMLRQRGRVVTEEGALPLAALTSPSQEPRRCYRPGRGEPVAVLLAGSPSIADQPDLTNPFRLQPLSIGGSTDN